MTVSYRSAGSALTRIALLWRNARFQRIVFQAAFAVVVVVVGYILIDNMSNELDRIGLELFPFVDTKSSFPFFETTWGFLNQRAGFSISETSFGYDYNANDSYRDAYVVGLLNTINVSVLGILLATALGFFIGIARLSKNWLLSHVALWYVEAFRNVPLLVQLTFWYVAIYLKLPRISDPVDLDVALISNRAVALAFVDTQPGFGTWVIVVAVALMAGTVAYVLRSRREDLTGHPSYPVWSAVGVFGTIALVGFLATGLPLSLDTPSVENRQVIGGAQMTPEYAALLTGLVVYTASFIAEIVRGSILAVAKGQTEAAAAVGLNPFQRMRYVILPQTLRILIPPLTNQYLNLMKNSSLAVAVAFKDVFDVTRVTINQAGQAVPMITLVMVTYLAMSLTISAVMNTIYGRLKWGSR